MNTTATEPVAAISTAVCFDRFLALWRDPDAVKQRWRLFAFISGLAFICGAAALIGAVPTRIYGHDIFTGLEGGWRVLNGQRPHVDFSCAWGPIWPLAVALGLTISRHSVNGVGYANAIVGLVVGAWSYILGKNRLASSPRIILSLFLSALVTAPYPLGKYFVMFSHAMVYNRYGYALLGIILLECIAPVRGLKDIRKQEWMGGVSTGAALCLTLFLKANFFFVGVVLIVVISPVLDRLGYRRILGFFIGFCILSTCVLGYLRFDVAAMLSDLRMAASARGGSMSTELIFGNAVAQASGLMEVIFLALAIALLCARRGPQSLGLKLITIGVLLFAGDILIMSSNAQSGGLPLCAVFGILMVSEMTEDYQSTPQGELSSRGPLYAGALFLGALLFVPQFTSDLAGLAFAVRAKRRAPPPTVVLQFTALNLQPLALVDGEEPRSNGRVFTSYVNDGVELLQRKTSPRQTIMTMDMTNPFSYALERRPPKGGILSPVYDHNLNDAHRPTDDQLFGDTDIVMVPRYPSIDDKPFMDFLNAYQQGLAQRYYLAEQTVWWRMYRRK